MKRNHTTRNDVPVEQLTIEEAKAELIELAELLAYHDQLYHEKDQPEITDAEYDTLRLRHNGIEARFPEFVLPSSPSHRVGHLPPPVLKRYATPCRCCRSAMLFPRRICATGWRG